MEIQKTIKEFLSFVLKEKQDEDDHSKLISLLDKLALLNSNISYNFDETDYPDAPEKDYKLIREKVEKRFPNFGNYNTVDYLSDKIGNSKILVGDAIDDLSDIVCDLQVIIWCFENTSKDDALWNYKDSFITHWGRHLRDLQLYLHDKLM